MLKKILNKLVNIIFTHKYFDELYRILSSIKKEQDQYIRSRRIKNNLNQNSFTIYSQSDEDGIIDQIFEKISIKSKFFVEIGVENGLENNTTFLLSQNWKGLWFEGNLKFKKEIEDSFSDCLKTNQLKVVFEYLNKENINMLLEENCKNIRPDLLSIDIGLNTFQVLKSITVIKPRVIVVEYNPIFGPTKNLVVEEQKIKKLWWSNEFMFGASLKAYEMLLTDYSIVACSESGANAFFVHNEEDLSAFEKPFNSEKYYENEKYYLIKATQPFHSKRIFKRTKSYVKLN